MSYIQLSVEATEAEQETLIAILSELNAIGFEQTDTHLIGYFDKNSFDAPQVNQSLQNYHYKTAEIPDQNWNKTWEKNFHPVIIDNFCGVRAHFHPPVYNVQHEIIITPKMSFGTGHHATTYLMINQMREIDFVNKNVLDFGTGTGILAILAEKLSAGSITAIDIDDWSIRNAAENIAKNNCFRINVYRDDSVPGKKFDLALININKNVILQQLDGLAKCSANGKILMSGFLQNDEEEIISAYKNVSFYVVCRQERSGWISLLLSHQNKIQV